MVSEGTSCLRQAAKGNRGKIVRFNRFLGHPKVTTDRIIESWGETTSVAARGRDVLAIQDTSDIKFKTTVDNRRGLGEVGKGNVYGLRLHAMIAVDADTAQCLGLVEGDIRTRQGRRETDHASRPLADKESRRWVDTARKGAAVLSEASRITVLADAECDIYPALVLIDRDGSFVLTWSSRDRRLVGRRSLYQEVASWPIAGTDTLEIRAQPGRGARTAQVEIRFGEVTLRRPDKTEPDMPDQFTLRVVEVREPRPPARSKPICWRLLTTHAVGSLYEAWRIVEMYRLRWVIEQFFRLLKSQGLGIEDSQVQSAERLCKLTAIAARASVITLQLVQARGGEWPEPAALVFDDNAVEALDAVAKARYHPRTKLQANPHKKGSLAWAAWIIARLGGWDGYPKSKPPGPITMKTGLDAFQNILIGWTVRET